MGDKIVVSYPSSDVPYTISDALKDRYPYTQPTFQQGLETMSNKVFPSFGFDGLKRNIEALQSDHFATEEKERALRILYTQLFDPKIQTRVLSFGILNSLKHLLETRPSSMCDRLTARVTQRIALMNDGRVQLESNGLVQLLLDIICDVEAGEARLEACRVLALMSRSREGVNVLLHPTAVDSKPSPFGRKSVAKRNAPVATTSSHGPGASGIQESMDASAFDGFDRPLLQSMDSVNRGSLQSEHGLDHDRSVVRVLVWVLEPYTSESSPELLLAAFETLINLCGTPHGREQSDQAGALPRLDALLRRDASSIAVNGEGLVIENVTLSILREAVHLVWMICLDGTGKRNGKALVLTLTQVFYSAVEALEPTLLRHTCGALMAILIYEPSKPLVLQSDNVGSEAIESKRSDASTSSITLIRLLCQFYDYLVQNPECFNHIQTLSETDRYDTILSNLKMCLRLALELPAARDSAREVFPKTHWENFQL